MHPMVGNVHPTRFPVFKGLVSGEGYPMVAGPAAKEAVSAFQYPKALHRPTS
jgi:hypothetical protein